MRQLRVKYRAITKAYEGTATFSSVLLVSIFLLVSILPLLLPVAGAAPVSRQGFVVIIDDVPTLYEDQLYVFRAHVPDVSDEMISSMSFSWNFGDIYSNGTNPNQIDGTGTASVAHVYTRSGIYDIDLTVRDSFSNFSSASITVEVKNIIPSPDIEILRQSTFVDEPITIQASGSIDGPSDMPGLQYRWTIDGVLDADYSKAVSIQRTYKEPGTHTVMLTVMDPMGATGSVYKTFRVDNQPPLAIIGQDIEAVEDGPVKFDGSSSQDTSSDSSKLSYEWQFGDGSSASGPKAEHIYRQSGKFIARLTVTDPFGATTLAEKMVKVQNLPPVAVGTFQNHGGGSFVVLDGSESKDSLSDMPDLSYDWTFEGGVWKTGKITTIRFYELGVHKVTLKVTDPEGASDTTDFLVTVTNFAPMASFAEIGKVVEDRQVQIIARNVVDSDGSPFECRWVVDGVPSNGWGAPTGMVFTFNTTFTDAGQHNVRLEMKDDAGASSWEELTFDVMNMAPVPGIDSDVIGIVGEDMFFDGTPTKDTSSDMIGLVFNWSYGDDDAGQGQLVRHRFEKAGEYEVQLMVTDHHGLHAVAKRIVTILSQEMLERFGGKVLSLEFQVDDQFDGDSGIGPDEGIRIIGQIGLVDGWDGPNLIARHGADISVRIQGISAARRATTGADGKFNMLVPAPSTTGKFTITVTGTIAPFTTNATTERTVVVSKKETAPIVSPMAVGAATAMAGLVAMGAVGGTDIGRYKFFTLMIPLFTRLRKPKVLDHFERGRIYEHIRKTPGDSYSSIRKALGIQNGALAHHLRVLEAHEYIVSHRDGMYKRFYPKGMKIPDGGHKSIQEQLLEMIMANPKINQKDMAGRLGIDRSTVNYHIKILLAMGVIRSEKEGKVKYYYFVGIKDPLPFEG